MFLLIFYFSGIYIKIVQCFSVVLLVLRRVTGVQLKVK